MKHGLRVDPHFEARSNAFCPSAMLRHVVVLSLLALSSAANIQVVNYFVNFVINEDELSLIMTLTQIAFYPNATGHYAPLLPYYYSKERKLKKIYPGLRLPMLTFQSRRMFSWTEEYSDGTALGYIENSKASLSCSLQDEDKFPRDRVVCVLAGEYSRAPFNCGSSPRFPCFNISQLEIAKWTMDSIKTKWYNSTFTSYYASFHILTFRRSPSFILTRIELPTVLFSAVLVSQLLLAPGSCSYRLLCSVLTHMGLHLVFLDVISFPVVGQHGGGALFGNLVAAMLSFNFVVFAWSVAVHVILENFSSAPLSPPLVQFLDVVFDKAGVLLLIPSHMVKEEESKAFSRRGDWLKLILLADRGLMLLGVVGISLCASQWLP